MVPRTRSGVRGLWIVAISLLAVVQLAPLTAANRAAKVYNHCPHDVYLWSIGHQEGRKKGTHVPSGSRYDEPYREIPGGGVSIKIGNHRAVRAGSSGPITQLEYGFDPAQGKIWYDVSNINCHGKHCPFHDKGLSLDSGPGCPRVRCLPMVDKCADVYNLPDDVQTRACGMDREIAMHLCKVLP